MPPRWSRKPDPQDPEYRKLGDRINFALHVAFFAACNSGVWFVRILKQTDWQWSIWLTTIWGVILLLHLIYIAAIADYSVESNG
jgi:hypothetical protein